MRKILRNSSLGKFVAYFVFVIIVGRRSRFTASVTEIGYLNGGRISIGRRSCSGSGFVVVGRALIFTHAVRSIFTRLALIRVRVEIFDVVFAGRVLQNFLNGLRNGWRSGQMCALRYESFWSGRVRYGIDDIIGSRVRVRAGGTSNTLFAGRSSFIRSVFRN